MIRYPKIEKLVHKVSFNKIGKKVLDTNFAKMPYISVYGIGILDMVVDTDVWHFSNFFTNFGAL